MNEPVCQQIGAWLRDAEQGVAPTDAIAAHIVGCAHCRSMIALLLAAHSATPTPPDTACATCQDDLAAYVDLERGHSSTLAAQTYPLVWWHLWLCPDCAEAYRVINILADREAAGALATLNFTPSLPQPRRAQLRLPQLRLQRAFLAQIFAMQTLAGVGWNSDAGDMVLAEGEEAGYSMCLSVQQQGDAECVITVTVEPPVSGQIVVRFGATIFRAPIDLQGIARVDGVPLNLLTAADGPEMIVSIEPESSGGTLDDSPP